MRTPLTLAVAMLLGTSLAVCGQTQVWVNPEATVRVPLPRGWHEHDGRDLRVYAERQGRYVVGPMFSRRAAGTLRVRNLSFVVYGLGSLEDQSQLYDLFASAERRVRQSFPVVLTEIDARPGISWLVYQFQHTGDPVTQAALFFADRNNSVYMIEVTGHRRDQQLLLGEARQILHSIDR